jgi:hypothetical protein
MHMQLTAPAISRPTAKHEAPSQSTLTFPQFIVLTTSTSPKHQQCVSPLPPLPYSPCRLLSSQQKILPRLPSPVPQARVQLSNLLPSLPNRARGARQPSVTLCSLGRVIVRTLSTESTIMLSLMSNPQLFPSSSALTRASKFGASLDLKSMKT